MSEQGREYTAEELAKLLDKARVRLPLTSEELDDNRELLRTIGPVLKDLLAMQAEWAYAKRAREERKGRWPVIFGIVSIVGTVITIVTSVIVNFFQGGKHP